MPYAKMPNAVDFDAFSMLCIDRIDDEIPEMATIITIIIKNNKMNKQKIN